jgi:hypothetical protein
MTDLDIQIEILGNFYLNYKDDRGIKDFIEFNDIGLPLAYLASEGLCEPTETAIVYIQETFNMLLGTMGLEDTGFESLDHVLSTAEEAGGPAAGTE